MSQYSQTKDHYPTQLTDSVIFPDRDDASSTRSHNTDRGRSATGRGTRQPDDQDNLLNWQPDAEDNYTVDKALIETAGSGMYQIKSQIVGVFSYCLHSQFIDLMPYLQLYPALLCADEAGKYLSCDRATACQNPAGYVLDWSYAVTLHNWTTELDLVCADSAKIGLMGTLAFITTGAGSIMFGGLVDQYGRRKTLLWCMTVTPLVNIMWLVYPTLWTIYFGLFWLGLVASPRYSAAYVFTTESLLTEAKKLQMIFYAFVNTLLLLFTKFFLKESPAYHYSKGNFAELEVSLEYISKSNGTYSRPQIEQIMAKLKANKQREEQQAGEGVSAPKTDIWSNLKVMCRSRVLRNNLIAMCCIWSVSGGCFYLIDFYVKYFPGSVFINKGVFGICDALSVNYAAQMDKRVNNVAYIVRVCLIGAVIFSIMYMTLAKYYMVLIPILIGLSRIHVNAILAYAYHMNQFLFPVLMRGAAFSMTGLTSKPAIGLTVFLAEYLSNPMYLVIALCVMNFGVTFMITEPNQEDLPTGKNCPASELSDALSTQTSKDLPFDASARSSLLETDSKRDKILASDTLKKKQETPPPIVPWRQNSQRPLDTASSSDSAADNSSAGQGQGNQQLIFDP